MFDGRLSELLCLLFLCCFLSSKYCVENTSFASENLSPILIFLEAVKLTERKKYFGCFCLHQEAVNYMQTFWIDGHLHQAAQLLQVV